MKENWKIGNYESTVVSDKKVKNDNYPCPPNPKFSSEKEKEYYGGYMVCESIGSSKHAQLIASAPDLLEACENFIKTFESTIGYQKYETNVFKVLNERYMQIKKAIEKATKI